MGTLISAGTGDAGSFCLDGFRRLVVGLTGEVRASTLPPEIYLELTFRVADVERPDRPMSAWTKDVGSPDDRILIKADLGSYRVRPVAGVKIVAPSGEWPVLAWQTVDPCVCEDTFWWTVVLPEGGWTPPPFYHRLRVL